MYGNYSYLGWYKDRNSVNLYGYFGLMLAISKLNLQHISMG